ncbi:filamentous hemagglutinin family outer membrane protein, partial [Leptolyngbya sp. Heron Island J]|uniref:two-partner secretion domain-containing protein n=1 Tax=Leptolyngbya sp. Heron Island J TaxID=1385935 RepID=UPI0003B9F448
MGTSGKTVWVTGAQQQSLIAYALVSSVVAICSYGSVAQAQPTSDGTLGTTVTPDPLVNNRFLINDGTPGGTNLFHSFIDFSIDPGQQVYFANPLGFTNILSRVTGPDFSNINGVLGVLDEVNNANLFLLNPRGVVFGPQAELDLNGSFRASTADSIGFANGGEFSLLTTATELLTFSTPLGVQFNDQPQGNISNQGNLAVGAGESLTLFGNSILNDGSLVSPGGTVQVLGNQVDFSNLASIDVVGNAGNGTALIAADEINFALGSSISGTGTLVLRPLSPDQNIILNDIADTDSTTLDLTATDLTALNDGFTSITIGQDDSTGSITLGGNTTFSDPVTLLTAGTINTTGGNLTGTDNASLTLQGSNVRTNDIIGFNALNIDTDGDITLGDYTGTALKVETMGSIQADNLRITGPDIASDDTLLATSRATILNAGINSTTGGDITVNSIDTSDSTGGDGGPIILDATGNITVLNNLNSYSYSDSGDAGDGGSITISSVSGDIITNGNMDSYSYAFYGDAGDGGSITISSVSGDI